MFLVIYQKNIPHWTILFILITFLYVVAYDQIRQNVPQLHVLSTVSRVRNTGVYILYIIIIKIKANAACKF